MLNIKWRFQSFLYQHRAPGYNPPEHFAMFLSQWAHQLFVRDVYSYETYVKLQNLSYRLFAPRGD